MPKKKSLSFQTNSSLKDIEKLISDFHTFLLSKIAGNIFRKSFHRYVSPYFITQSKINSALLTKINNLESNLKATKQNYTKHIKELNLHVQNLETTNIDLKNRFQLFSDVILKSTHGDINALKEKNAFLMNLAYPQLGDFRAAGQQAKKVFYSQFGEDEWVANNISSLPKKGFFIEVGAVDGITFSNTYYFEKLGWRGICFEPHPNQYQQARLFRQNVEQTAICKKDGQIDLYISGSYPDWSSTIKSNDASDKISVKCKTLNTVVKENKIKRLDLLSIDVEGAEVEVLQGLDFNYLKPKIIIIEFLNKMNQENTEIKKFMQNLPYKLVHQTYANYIYTFNKL